jgi:hypothetical protein
MTMEWHRVPLSTPQRFRKRLIGTGTFGLVLVAISLAIGMGGYMLLEGLAPIDAFLNAAMILSGMGPLHNPATTGGKLFAGLYALYCGVAVLGIAAIMFAPVIHRLFHRFRIDDVDAAGKH